MFVAAFLLQAIELLLFFLIEPLGHVMGVHHIPWAWSLVLFGVFVAVFLLAEAIKPLGRVAISLKKK